MVWRPLVAMAMMSDQLLTLHSPKRLGPVATTVPSLRRPTMWLALDDSALMFGHSSSFSFQPMHYTQPVSLTAAVC